MLKSLRDALIAEKRGLTFAQLAEKYGVNQFYLWKIIDDPGYVPPAKVAKTLGLDVYKPAPVCPDCGEVHSVSWCTKVTPAIPAPPSKNGTGAKKKRPPSIYVGKPSPEQAEAIKSLTPAERLEALLEAAKDRTRIK